MRKRTTFEQVRDAFWYGIPVAGLIFIGFFVVLWSLMKDSWSFIRRRPF